MIVMINGSFGVGKTSIAKMLTEKLPNAMIYDPEIVGAALKELTEGVRDKKEMTDDFRDIALWPEMVVKVGQALKSQYQKDLIVPMTIENLNRLKFIQAGFRQFDDAVHHFCLTAPLHEVLRRIGARSEGNGEWTIRKATECAEPVCGPCVAAFSLDIEGDDLTRLNALAAFFGETAEAHLRRRVAYWVELDHWMMEDEKDEAANPRCYGSGVALLSPPCRLEGLSQYPSVKGPKDGWRREEVAWLSS